MNERSAARTLPTQNLTKQSITGSDLNLPQVEWKGDVEKVSGFQALVNNLVLDNGCTQAVSGPTRGDVLLDLYLLRPGSSLISCNILPRISNHNGVLLEVEWDENYPEPKISPGVSQNNVLGLQAFLWEKFNL